MRWWRPNASLSQTNTGEITTMMKRWRPNAALPQTKCSPIVDQLGNHPSPLHRFDLSSTSPSHRSPLFVGFRSVRLSPLSSHFRSVTAQDRDWHNLTGKSGLSISYFHSPSGKCRYSQWVGSPVSPYDLSSSFGLSRRRSFLYQWLVRRAISSSVEGTSRPDSGKISEAVSGRVTEIVEDVVGLTLLEVADLTEVLRKKFSIEEMPVMSVMMPGMGFGGVATGVRPGAGKAEETKAEKTAFDLKLESFDASAKIKIIKEVRTFTDLGLKEAKDLVEKAPALLKKGVPKEEAEKIMEKMKAVGANVVME